MTRWLKTLYENLFVILCPDISVYNCWKMVLKSKSVLNCFIRSKCCFQNLQKLFSKSTKPPKTIPHKTDLSFSLLYVLSPSSSLYQYRILSIWKQIHSLQVMISYSINDFWKQDLSNDVYGISNSVPYLTTSTTWPEVIGQYCSASINTNICKIQLFIISQHSWQEGYLIFANWLKPLTLSLQPWTVKRM